MRRDEAGQECPATLGEYRDMVAECLRLAGVPLAGSKAVELLDKKIAVNSLGRGGIVIPDDSQMRSLLMPLLNGDILAGYKTTSREDLCKCGAKRGVHQGPRRRTRDCAGFEIALPEEPVV